MKRHACDSLRFRVVREARIALVIAVSLEERIVDIKCCDLGSLLSGRFVLLDMGGMMEC